MSDIKPSTSVFRPLQTASIQENQRRPQSGTIVLKFMEGSEGLYISHDQFALLTKINQPSETDAIWISHTKDAFLKYITPFLTGCLETVPISDKNSLGAFLSEAQYFGLELSQNQIFLIHRMAGLDVKITKLGEYLARKLRRDGKTFKSKKTAEKIRQFLIVILQYLQAISPNNTDIKSLPEIVLNGIRERSLIDLLTLNFKFPNLVFTIVDVLDCVLKDEDPRFSFDFAININVGDLLSNFTSSNLDSILSGGKQLMGI